MVSLSDNFDRVSKLLVDTRELKPDEARAILSAVPLVVRTGPSVSDSRAEQAALLTLANLAMRVFKRPLRVLPCGSELRSCPRIPWPASSLEDALVALGAEFVSDTDDGQHNLLLGSARGHGLRMTHSGWCGRVAPHDWPGHLEGEQGNALAGIASAGLALGEVFFRVANINPESLHRPIELSLWRPDLPCSAPGAIGPALRYLPSELWVLGLGHLGQGALWALGMLPLRHPQQFELVLQDCDRAIPGNFGPQALMGLGDAGKRKTRICADFLAMRGIDPAIVDRPFDECLHRGLDEPALAVAAFDGGGPRWLLDKSGFEAVVTLGVGGSAHDFDEIHLHTLPLANTRASDIWHPVSGGGRAEALASTNAYYRSVLDQHHCGDVELAGVSVAVPFVGAIAGVMAISEFIRPLSGGGQFSFAQRQLRSGQRGRQRHRSDAEALHPRTVRGYQSIGVE